MRLRVALYSFIALVYLAVLTPMYHSVDPDLKPYFDDLAEISHGNLEGTERAGFIPKHDKFAGRCYLVHSEIQINKEYWGRIPYINKMLLLAHEVAHCEKGCDHTNEVDELGCPESIMHYQTINSVCIKLNLKKYIEEMRTIDCRK